jgi:hypothetical protein
MESLPKLALALEGSWRIEFEGIAVGPCFVDIENRKLAGQNAAHRVIGDFRLEGARVTLFLRVGKREAPAAEDVILTVSGAYHVGKMTLRGGYVLSPEHHVIVTLGRNIRQRFGEAAQVSDDGERGIVE